MRLNLYLSVCPACLRSLLDIGILYHPLVAILDHPDPGSNDFQQSSELVVYQCFYLTHDVFVL